MANLSAVLSSIQAAQAHAQAVGKQSGSVRKATATFHADIDALRAHLIALGLSKTQVDNVIKSYLTFRTSR